MEASNRDWEIPNSDDERDSSLIACKGSPSDDIPVQVLQHYDEIAKQGYIELKVKEYRRVRSKESSEQQSDGSDDKPADEKLVCSADVKSDQHDKDSKKSPKHSAFDYQDESDECQGQMPRRTPKSGRASKKRVGSLQNVISNLKRFRELDHSFSEEENKTSICDQTKSSPEESKETKEDKESADVVNVEEAE